MARAYEHIKHVYLIGIGGIGMSALARYFRMRGKTVSGYDRGETALTKQLEEEGIVIHYDDDPSQIPSALLDPSTSLVIYTPAVPADLAEKKFLEARGIVLYKRAQVLGEIAKGYRTLAVAGTHGKTTTSTLLAHILRSSGKKCNAFLGGISTNYGTNLLLDENAEFMVVEADEYDRSFLTLHPFAAVLTSTDADHLDIYGTSKEVTESYSKFLKQVDENGFSLVNEKISGMVSSAAGQYTYGSMKSSHFHSEEVHVENGAFVFTIRAGQIQIGGIRLALPGRHNVENAVAATGVALAIGIDPGEIKKAIESFTGVKRRFEFHIRGNDLTYVDDYAHHPAELHAVITAIKELMPGKKITGVFQPHLFSRTRDFADDFARSLELLDECLLLEIYPAREKPISGVNASWLLDKIAMNDKAVVAKDRLVDELRKRKPEVLITMGAGDIDTMVEPIKEAFR